MNKHNMNRERQTGDVALDADFSALTQQWLMIAISRQYAHNFTWLGRPVIQVPQDIYAIQEIMWACKPDLVIETGVAHGGSLVMSASMLVLQDYCDAMESGKVVDPRESRRKVIGVDIDIRPHNRRALATHPLRHKLHLVEGSSVSPEVMQEIATHAKGYERILVLLDSNHTYEHVLTELELYAPYVSEDSYCIVWDTGVEDLPEHMCANRPWGKGNNPKTAVTEYMIRLQEEGRYARDGDILRFEIDKEIENKIVITASPGGFLKRVKTGR